MPVRRREIRLVREIAKIDFLHYRHAAGGRPMLFEWRRRMTTDYDRVIEKLKRWRSRLKRAVNAIDKLERQRARLERRMADAKDSERAKVKAAHDAAMALINEEPSGEPSTRLPLILSRVETKPTSRGETIPDFLRRQKEGERKEAEAAKAIKAEQEDRRKQKSRGRVAKMMAKKAGDLDRMPLSGKAALAAIRS
jgi:hypothetical protein